MRTIIASAENCQPSQVSTLYAWSVDASELGLRPGEVPGQICTTLGNGLNFCAPVTTTNTRGEIICWRYRQHLGCLVLSVFND